MLLRKKTQFMQIKHLTHQEIDINLWDDVISNSFNHLFYAFSWYLDAVSPEWEALVSDNYTFIMPLPVKRKFKIPYLVQPVMTQQLGVFSMYPIDEAILNEFIQKIPYPSYELNLNEKNEIPKIECRPNFLLSLEKSYLELKRQFSSNTLRNLEKSHKSDLNINFDESESVFLDFYLKTDKNYSSLNKEILTELISKGISHQMLKIYSAYNSQNEILASVCILISKHRITYLLPVSNAEGKRKSAMFLIVDRIIQEFSNKNYILDFEGSQIDGVARFYKGFGATNHPYFVIRKWRPSFLIGRI